MKTLSVNTIYPAFMGEVNTHGIGVPCTFVRLAGCNLRCYFKTKGILCDTPEALYPSSGAFMTVPHILERVRKFGNKVVCLTGGEPLLQDVSDLLNELSSSGFYVVIETNGSKSIAPYRHIRNVSFIVDVKSLSSGESEKMVEDNYSLLDEKDFVKFVIDTKDDYAEFHSWVTSHERLKCNVAVGLFWGSEVTYQWLMEQVIRTSFGVPIHLNMQSHKMTCLYDKYKESESFGDLFIPKDI